MSRPGTTSAQRGLTLTEELEKLEQSITLTLQEIDHNFNRAHRIVTSSILPVVEKYAEHSRNVWEGSKFWKQFFEASANVSLNGYEETGEDGLEEEDTLTTESTAESTTTSGGGGGGDDGGGEDGSAYDDDATPSSYSSAPRQEYAEPFTPASAHFNETSTPSDFSSPTHTTPRASAPTVAAYASPYEALRREVRGSETPSTPSASTLPSTPRAQTLDDTSAEAEGESAVHAPDPPTTERRQRRAPRAADPVLHRVLDKTYRIQATPHRGQPRVRQQEQQQQQRSARTPARTPATAAKGGAAYTQQLDLDSSPLEEAPRLHAEMFAEPAKTPRRVPGVSVLNTPGGGGLEGDTTDVGGLATGGRTTTTGGRVGGMAAGGGLGMYGDDDDSDDDYDLLPKGMSPPKTMQFHIPQSKLLKTPAKEASRQIMEDLLASAGDDLTDDVDADSPSVVKRGLLEEETF